MPMMQTRRRFLIPLAGGGRRQDLCALGRPIAGERGTEKIKFVAHPKVS